MADNNNNNNKTPADLLAPARMPPAIVCFNCKWPTELQLCDDDTVYLAPPCQNPTCKFFIPMNLPLPGQPPKQFVSGSEMMIKK